MWVHGFECSRAVHSLVCVPCFMLKRGARILLHSCLEFRFHVEVRTLALHVLSPCVSVRSRVRSAARSSVHMCFVVLHAACEFHWLRAFMLSCLVWTHGLWVFSLDACLCPVLHMAGDLFAGHVLVFLFCVSTWLCLHFLCHVLSCQFVLTPPTLFPDYWLICPTCLCSLPSSFAPFILSLCLQSYASSSLNVSCSCPAKPCQLSWFSPMG